MEPEEVKTRDDLVRYLTAMSSSVEGFENRRLETFLEAASGWLADMDGYFVNRDEPVPVQPSWSLLATILTAATQYE